MRLRLERGTCRGRRQRFFADVTLPGEGEVVAHCANTGTMRTLLADGAEAWLRRSDRPGRKLPLTLVLLGVPGGRALVDTSLPNAIVAEGIAAGVLPSLAGYATLRREARLGGRSRFDLLLEEPADGSGRSCAVEVKNVTMLSGTTERRADFPDAVTERGRRHLEELASLAERGLRAVQLYLLGRTDCDRVALAPEIDPAYAEALALARRRGVEVVVARLAIDDEPDGTTALRIEGEARFEG